MAGGMRWGTAAASAWTGAEAGAGGGLGALGRGGNARYGAALGAARTAVDSGFPQAPFTPISVSASASVSGSAAAQTDTW